MPSLPALGSCLTYRDTNALGLPRERRYKFGRVFALLNGQPLVLVGGKLVHLRRSCVGAHWKTCERLSFGWFAPGSPWHNRDIWERVVAAGALPPAWWRLPEGEPFTATRLMSVATRLKLIDAPEVTAEDSAARFLFGRTTRPGEEDITAYIVSLRRNGRRNKEPKLVCLADYLDTYLSRTKQS